MNSFRLYFLFILIATISFGFAISQETSTLKDNNYQTFVLNNNLSCKTIDLDEIIFKEKIGVFGIYLHSTFNLDSGYLIFRDESGEPILNKNHVGTKINFRHYAKDFQNEYLFLNLNDRRNLKSIEICAYLNQNDAVTIYDDSKVGFFKIPDFECENCFTKFIDMQKYKVGERVPIKINITNYGYEKVEISAFYDNEIFTDWFKLKKGNPSYKGILDVNENVTLEYKIEPLISESFTISPAIINYKFDGYEFNVKSNPIIVSPAKTLDLINCNVNVLKRKYANNETAILEIILFNDFDKINDLELTIRGNNTLEETLNIELNPREIKEIKYGTTNSNKLINYKVEFQKDEDNKFCDEESILFEDEKSQYLNYIIFLMVLISIAIFIYYYYFF